MFDDGGGGDGGCDGLRADEEAEPGGAHVQDVRPDLIGCGFPVVHRRQRRLWQWQRIGLTGVNAKPAGCGGNGGGDGFVSLNCSPVGNIVAASKKHSQPWWFGSRTAT